MLARAHTESSSPDARARSTHANPGNTLPHLAAGFGNQAVLRMQRKTEAARPLSTNIGNQAALRSLNTDRSGAPAAGANSVDPRDISASLDFGTAAGPSPRPGGPPFGAKARASVSDSSMRMTTPFAGSPPTFENWGGGLLCKSPVFAATANVTVPPAAANGDLTAGFMQALVSCTGPTGHYYDENDAPYMSAFAPYSALPLRDADPSGVFYGPEAQTAVTSTTVQTSMADQPQTSHAWTTPDGKGKLQQIVGQHKFVTWLVVKSDSTGQIDPLRYFVWEIGWFAGVDQSMPAGTAFDVGRITDAGEGQGPMAPIRSGPVVNDSSLPVQWLPWH